MTSPTPMASLNHNGSSSQPREKFQIVLPFARESIGGDHLTSAEKRKVNALNKANGLQHLIDERNGQDGRREGQPLARIFVPGKPAAKRRSKIISMKTFEAALDKKLPPPTPFNRY